MLAVFVWKWDKASLVLAHLRINLFEGAGGYFGLWYAIAVVLALSLFTGDALRARSWTRSRRGHRGRIAQPRGDEA